MSRAHVLIVLLILASPAHAQVDAGVIADPISRTDLEDWVIRLELSDDQSRALDSLYSGYLELHRAMRDGPLAEFLRDHEDFGNSTTEITTDVDVARETMRELRALHRTLRLLDGRLIEQLAPVLTEEQLPRLERVRAARDRARLFGGPAQRSYHPALDTDLSAPYRAMASTLDGETRGRTDTIVDLYERSLTAKAKDIDRFALRYEVGMAEGYGSSLAEAGSDAAEHDFALRAVQVRHWQSELARRAGDVGDLHRALCRDLAKRYSESGRASSLPPTASSKPCSTRSMRGDGRTSLTPSRCRSARTTPTSTRIPRTTTARCESCRSTSPASTATRSIASRPSWTRASPSR
jgi:hypothetical protein